MKFSEKVTGGTFTVNGEQAQAEASADDRTFHLTAAEGALVNGQNVTIAASGIRDLAGNALAANTISFPYWQGSSWLPDRQQRLYGKCGGRHRVHRHDPGPGQ